MAAAEEVPARGDVEQQREVEDYLRRNVVDDRAGKAFRELEPELQRQVMDIDLKRCRNPSAYLHSLISNARKGELVSRQRHEHRPPRHEGVGHREGGSSRDDAALDREPEPPRPGHAAEVLDFIGRHDLDDEACIALRALEPAQQVEIMQMNIGYHRNPSALVSGRIRALQRQAREGGRPAEERREAEGQDRPDGPRHERPSPHRGVRPDRPVGGRPRHDADDYGSRRPDDADDYGSRRHDADDYGSRRGASDEVRRSRSRDDRSQQAAPEGLGWREEVKREAPEEEGPPAPAPEEAGEPRGADEPRRGGDAGDGGLQLTRAPPRAARPPGTPPPPHLIYNVCAPPPPVPVRSAEGEPLPGPAEPAAPGPDRDHPEADAADQPPLERRRPREPEADLDHRGPAKRHRGSRPLDLGVEGFLRFHRIDAKACQALRNMEPEDQKIVMDLDLSKFRNPSAFLWARIRKMRNPPGRDQSPLPPPGDREGPPASEPPAASAAPGAPPPAALPLPPPPPAPVPRRSEGGRRELEPLGGPGVHFFAKNPGPEPPAAHGGPDDGRAGRGFRGRQRDRSRERERSRERSRGDRRRGPREAHRRGHEAPHRGHEPHSRGHEAPHRGHEAPDRGREAPHRGHEAPHRGHEAAPRGPPGGREAPGRREAAAPAPTTPPQALAAAGAVEASAGQAVFTLRRCGGPLELPDFFEVQAGSPPLTIGRAATCDLVLRVLHVSKVHAQLQLQEAPGSGWMLMLQDTSSNGTWLNGQKLLPKRWVQVQPGDRFAFCPPAGEGPEPPSYELLSGSAAPAPLPEGEGGAVGSHAGSALGYDDRGSAIPSAPSQAGGWPTWQQPGQVPEGGGEGLDIGSAAGGISSWLRSLGPSLVVNYEELLLATYDDLAQVRDLYCDRAEDFFEDIGVESPEHREIFREALQRLRVAAL